MNLNPLGWGSNLRLVADAANMSCPKNVQVSFKNILEKNLYADEVVHQPPHAGGLSSLGDLGIHIIIMIYHEISYINKPSLEMQ